MTGEVDLQAVTEVDITDVSTISALGSGFSVFALLAWLIIRMMSQHSKDMQAMRISRDKQIEGMEERYIREMHSRDLRITTLEDQLDKTVKELEQARRLRWEAEDAAARWRRAAGGAHSGGAGTD